MAKMRRAKKMGKAGTPKTRRPHCYAVAALTIDGFTARYSGHSPSTWTSKDDKRHLQKMEKKADVLLIASKTYRQSYSHYKTRNCLVLTRRVKKMKKAGPLETHINPKVNITKYLQKTGYGEVCVMGGRTAYTLALKNNMVDDLYITVEPLVFGKGIGLFAQGVKTRNFVLVNAKKMNRKGSMLLHYRKAR